MSIQDEIEGPLKDGGYGDWQKQLREAEERLRNEEKRKKVEEMIRIALVPKQAPKEPGPVAAALPNKAPKLGATLAERGSRYGAFSDHARITQELKGVMATGNWDRLTPIQKESLEMIAHKIGRILCGDPNYVDSWHDVAGYATLVEQELTA